MVGVDRPIKAPSMHIQTPYKGKIVYLSSHSCHFVKNYFFRTKFIHAYVQCVYIVQEKYQIVPSKAVVGVDWPVYGL